jgi:hypothetical protein
VSILPFFSVVKKNGLLLAFKLILYRYFDEDAKKIVVVEEKNVFLFSFKLLWIRLFGTKLYNCFP